MRKVIQSSEICSYIPDGATLFFTGITMGNVPEESIVEIEKSFLETGHPRDLTLYTASAMGDRNTRGLNHISYPGLLKRVVAGHLVNCGDNMVRLCREEKAEVYNFPQGVLSTMPRYRSGQCQHAQRRQHRSGRFHECGRRRQMDCLYRHLYRRHRQTG